jgi:ADP-ribosylglycohydrolase
MSRREILGAYGPDGIREMGRAYGRLGAITDDTQMTLFTVEGFIRYEVRGVGRGIASHPGMMRRAYERWLETQTRGGPETSADQSGWLIQVPELYSRRAPGATCLSALSSPPPSQAVSQSLAAQNDSKGCGGVMRVAPLGLVAQDPYGYGAEAAALTHGHPLGYQSAGAMALLIAHAAGDLPLEDAVARTVAELPPDAREMGDWMTRAADLALSDRPAPDCIGRLGEGWVAEETLAIGLFCALRGDTLEEAVILGVNHDGDSDSTGSIAGQIRGTREGVEAIPERWLAPLELREVIQRLADDLYDWTTDPNLRRQDVPDEWFKRYPGG